MSKQNTLQMKRRRSVERQARKHVASKVMPFGGCGIDKKTVVRHRYAKSAGLGFSANVAAVLVGAIARLTPPPDFRPRLPGRI